MYKAGSVYIIRLVNDVESSLMLELQSVAVHFFTILGPLHTLVFESADLYKDVSPTHHHTDTQNMTQRR